MRFVAHWSSSQSQQQVVAAQSSHLSNPCLVAFQEAPDIFISQHSTDQVTLP
jgi:hypothetical protein